MIKEEFIDVKVGHKTVEYYSSLGYVCKYGDILRIKSKDVAKGSRVKITVICGNPKCENPEVRVDMNNYTKSISKELNTYYCKKCLTAKRIKKAEVKQSQGSLTREDDYYFTFEENRIKEFHEFINKHKVIDKMVMTDKALYAGITKYGEGVPALAKKLGYNIEDISNTFVDNRGDHNRSKIECFVANYLIANGLKDNYLRNVIIDSENGRHDCDFVLKSIEDNKDICIEVWGFSPKDKTSRSSYYNEKRKIKEEIYKNNEDSKILVSLEYEDFNCDFEQMQINIENKLKPYIKKNFQIINWNQIKSFKDYSEDEIIKELLKYSQNGMMPTRTQLLVDSHGASLNNYINRHFKNALTYFRNKMNLIGGKKEEGFWNEQEVYKVFTHMLNKYHNILQLKDIQLYAKTDHIFVGAHDYMNKNGGYLKWRIKFCKHCLVNNINLQYIDIIKECLQSHYNKRNIDVLKESQDLLRTYFNL